MTREEPVEERDLGGGWDEAAQARCAARMAKVDAMPPALKECVYDFGLTLVDQFLQAGIRDPKKIRTLIAAVWEGSKEIGNRKGQPAEGREPYSVRYINEALAIAGLPPVGRHIAAHLRHRGRVLAPKAPSSGMIAASMAALDDPSLGGRRLGTEEKHRIRLKRALERAALDEIGDGR